MSEPENHEKDEAPATYARDAEVDPGLTRTRLPPSLRPRHTTASPPTRPHLPTLRRRLSEERLRPYDRWAAGDHVASLRLYEWNTAVSAAFYESLQALEVTLRNAIHEQLTRLHAERGRSGQWYDDPARVLLPPAREDIDRARKRLRATGKPATPGRIVAELPFGFWRFLCSARYEVSLWRPALRYAFAIRPPFQRSEVAAPLARLHALRNRVAHHEPVYRRNLAQDWHDVLLVAGAICPQVQAWIGLTSRVPELLAARPRDRGQR